jgi:hypothetical protein
MTSFGYNIRIISDTRVRLEVGTPRRLLFTGISAVLFLVFLIISFEPMIPETIIGIILILIMSLVCGIVGGLNRYFDFDTQTKTFTLGITLFGLMVLKEWHDLAEISALRIVSVSYNHDEQLDPKIKSNASPLLGVFLPGRSSIKPYKEYVNLSIELGDKKISLEDSQLPQILLVHGQFFSQFLSVPLKNEQK